MKKCEQCNKLTKCLNKNLGESQWLCYTCYYEREGLTDEGKPIFKKQVERRNRGLRTKNLSRKKPTLRSSKRASNTRVKSRKARSSRL